MRTRREETAISLVRLHVVGPPRVGDQAVGLLTGRPGVVVITRLAAEQPGTDVVSADIAREIADDLLTELHRIGVTDSGMITLVPIDTAIGALARRAEENAPGEGDDTVIWGELLARTGGDSTFTWTFLAFIVLATLLAAIGVVTDSQITIVGAMVIGPEFGPLAGLAVGLVRRRPKITRRAGIALGLGFPVAIVVTALLTVLARATRLVSPSDLVGHRETDFIYHPGWFSLITALVAGTAGMLSLTSSKAAALVGVFISVTTIPAAGNAAVAGVLGKWDETWQSMAQLGINLVGIVAAGAVTLVLRGGARARAA